MTSSAVLFVSVLLVVHFVSVFALLPYQTSLAKTLVFSVVVYVQLTLCKLN